MTSHPKLPDIVERLNKCCNPLVMAQIPGGYVLVHMDDVTAAVVEIERLRSLALAEVVAALHEMAPGIRDHDVLDAVEKDDENIRSSVPALYEYPRDYHHSDVTALAIVLCHANCAASEQGKACEGCGAKDVDYGIRAEAVAALNFFRRSPTPAEDGEGLREALEQIALITASGRTTELLAKMAQVNVLARAALSSGRDGKKS